MLSKFSKDIIINTYTHIFLYVHTHTHAHVQHTYKARRKVRKDNSHCKQETGKERMWLIGIFFFFICILLYGLFYIIWFLKIKQTFQIFRNKRMCHPSK